MLALYHNDVAVCAQKVRIALAEKELAYDSRLLDLRAGESHTPDYLKLNPKGVVPTLIDGDVVVTESSIINEYLEQQFPAIRLTFDNDTGLLRICGRVSFGIAFRHQPQTEQLASRSAPERAAQEERNAAGMNHPEAQAAIVQYDALLSDMNTVLAHHAWLAGEQFSLADCAILPYIKRLDDLALAWLWEDNPQREPMYAWYERCKTRRSFTLALQDYLTAEKATLMRQSGEAIKPLIQQLLSKNTANS